MTNLIRKYKLIVCLLRITNAQKAKNSTSSEILVPGMIQKFWQQVSIKDYSIAAKIAAAYKPIPQLERTVLDQLKIDSLQFLAYASVGIVYKGNIGGQTHAIKVKHPGIDKILTKDMQFLRRITQLISFWLPLEIKKHLYSIIDEASREIMEESDYSKETANHKSFHNTQLDEEIIIPVLNQKYCSENMIVSEYSSGQTLASFLSSGEPADKRWFLDTYHRFILNNLLHYGKLHADPHPNNFLVETDRNGQKRLVVLDFGCVIDYSTEFITALNELLMEASATTINDEKLLDLLGKLGFDSNSLQYYRPVIPWLVRVILEPYIEDRDMIYSDWNIDYKISTILSSRVWERPLSFSSDLLFLFRVYNALISYWRQSNIPINWYQSIKTIWGGFETDEKKQSLPVEDNTFNGS